MPWSATPPHPATSTPSPAPACRWQGRSSGSGRAVSPPPWPPPCRMPPPAQDLAIPALRGGVLVVVGSIAEASRGAAERLVGRGGRRRASTSRRHCCAPAPPIRAGRRLPTGSRASLAAGRDALVRIAAEPGCRPRPGRSPGRGAGGAAGTGRVRMGGLFATGGETACALLTHLGVHGIRLLEEVEPGVPLGITQGALEVPVMTKAGAFGDDETILRSLVRLRDSFPGHPPA